MDRVHVRCFTASELMTRSQPALDGERQMATAATVAATRPAILESRVALLQAQLEYIQAAEEMDPAIKRRPR